MYGINHHERIKLNSKIKEWNADRLDLFQISEPDDYLEFYGVMRFFYQGDDLKYQTKCLRVSSTATTIDVVEALINKFHLDSKKSNCDKYVIYECYNLHERRIKNSEHPLIVQLNWASDDKEGKFILKNESRRRRSTDMPNHSILTNHSLSQSTTALANGFDNQTLRSQSSAVYSSSSNFFSRRFSSSKNSKRKTKADKQALQDAEETKRLAEEMSGKPPESSFTRTISNPDDVMKRRRQKKLESRLEQFAGVKGDGETGGTLKIYGDSINADIPYKTLLLSVNDPAEKVLLETLDKYGIAPEEQHNYVLVQQNIPPRENRNRVNTEEIILHDQDCPLGILVNCPPKQGSAMFAVRKRHKSDRLPLTPRMPPVALSKKSPSIVAPEDPRIPSSTSQTSSVLLPVPSDIYSDTVVEYPRLQKLFIDADGTLYDEENGLFALSSLVNQQRKDTAPTDGSKLIKIGSQRSSLGNYPNIWLSSEEYADIRPIQCHISAKLDPLTNRMKFQMTPTLDSSSRTPRPCVTFINQQRIENTSRLCNGDIIQLGESLMFRFEEFEDEQTESITSHSVEHSEQRTVENATDSVNISHHTAELPVTIKYKYKRSVKLVGRIMRYSKEYSEKGSKELYSDSLKCDDNSLNETFRLSPAYMMYLVMRAGLSNDQDIVQLIDLIADNIDQAIHEDRNNVEKEIFWLSNSSELLHLLQYDNDLRFYSATAQDVLAGTIDHTFSIIQQQFSKDLLILLPALLSEDDLDTNDNTQEDNIPCLDRACVLIEQGSIDYPIQHLLQTLSLAFNLFHNCQVNVALTIQMFSQLFHLLNTWLFNSVLGDSSNTNDSSSGFAVPVCQEWGDRLTRRLNRIRYWSEINGLEMAANCHLLKMYQVAELMKADKSDLAIFGEKCIEMISLNGAQLQHLLVNCQDYDLPDPWIEVVVNTAIQLHEQDFTVDSKPADSQNRTTLTLYEDMELSLPLLLPADGYLCDRGIASCPRDLELMLNFVNDNLKYRLNPPVLDKIDIRWRAYLSTCENTPVVSRSNTINQSPISPIKSNAPCLPRNWVNEQEPSEEVSSTETLSSLPRDRYQKKPINTPQTKNSVQSSHSSSVDLSNHSILKQVSNNLTELKLKKINNSLGLSIIAAKAADEDIFRIYVKDVIADGAGHKSGKIFSGDQLVSIDGHLLEDMTQDEAVIFMKKTKSEVTLVVDRGAAQRYGLMEAIIQARGAKNGPPNSNSVQRSLNTQSPAIKKPLSTLHTPPKINTSKPDKPLRLSLPPPPTMKAPPKPLTAMPTNNIKYSSNKALNLAPGESDYNSLPIRKHQNNSDVPVTAVGKKSQPLKVKFDMNFNSLQNKSSLSNSQPNLNNFSKDSKRSREKSSSNSSSSSTISSTDEDDDDTENVGTKPQPIITDNTKRNFSSVYEKLPQQQLQQKPLNNGPVKAGSDLNIATNYHGLPRAEVKQIEQDLPKKHIFTRPTLSENSDHGISSQDETEPLSLNKPVTRYESSSSESESETISSHTESSSSSDSSPQPQGHLNPETLPKETNPIKPPQQPQPQQQPEMQPQIQKPSQLQQITQDQSTLQHENKHEELQPELPPVTLPAITDRKPVASVPNLGGFIKPFRISATKCDESVSSLPTKESLNSVKDVNKDMAKVEHDKKKISLKDTSEIKFELPKAPTEEEVKLRRKAIADSIRAETEERERRSHTFDTPLDILLGENKEPPKTATKYGRPQFNTATQATRPASLFKPDTNTNFHEHDFMFLSPPSAIVPGAIIVPSSPLNKSIPIITSNNNNSTKSQDGVEQLSFQEKMKLFAAKSGDETVIERKKFSSKQQKINSGDYS